MSKSNSIPIGYAFWKYDLFPYVAGGAFTRINDDGTVYAPSYQGVFRPIAIFNETSGKVLADQLTVLRKQREAMLENLDQQFAVKLAKLFPGVKVTP